MKTEPVMDSTDYAGLELRSSLIKSEDTEESIERKNGCGMSREEELILSNIKEEEEEGGERQREEVKREDGVKDEEVVGYEWKGENESVEWTERDPMNPKSTQTDVGLRKEVCMKQEEEGPSSTVTSCLLKQPRVPSPGSPLISSSKGKGNQAILKPWPFYDFSCVSYLKLFCELWEF